MEWLGMSTKEKENDNDNNNAEKYVIIEKDTLYGGIYHKVIGKIVGEEQDIHYIIEPLYGYQICPSEGKLSKRKRIWVRKEDVIEIPLGCLYILRLLQKEKI